MSRNLLSLFAFILVVMGFAVATLCWFFPRWPQSVSWAALGIEILGFVLAMRAWGRWLAKVALSGAVVFFALTLLAFFFGPTPQRTIQPTADWMIPLETTWELQ